MDEKEILFGKLERDELYLEDLEAYLADQGKLQDFFQGIGHKNSVIKILVLDQLLHSKKSGMSGYLLDWLKNEGEAKVIARLLIVIGCMENEELVMHLAPFLKSEDRRVRANAVEAIGKLKTPVTRELLLPYLEDEDNRVRANTAMALWNYQDLQATIREAFFSMLHDHDKWMQASALYAFGELGIKDFVDYLFNQLRNEDEDICRNALIALIGFAERTTAKGEK
ncbi:MAG: HEAT repeat domain-containing protein [Candidatus Wallbacteria bacterium]|nr:HEAT repeat domain-containing protein [Candidatus Wallbacteria bacterium]